MPMLSPDAIDAFAARDDDALRVALGLRPWEASPMDAHDGPSPWPEGSAGARSWPLAQRLRRELMAAVAARKKGDRQ